MNNLRLLVLLITLFGCCATTNSAYAKSMLRGVGASYGEGQNDISMYRLDLLSKDWLLHSSDTGHISLLGHIELGLAVWDGASDEYKYDTLYELGLTPVIQLISHRLYLEAGTGPRLITPTSLQDRTFSTALQFGSLLGCGFLLRHEPFTELGFRMQHISNGDMAEPNPGIDFKLMQLRLRIDF